MKTPRYRPHFLLAILGVARWVSGSRHSSVPNPRSRCVRTLNRTQTPPSPIREKVSSISFINQKAAIVAACAAAIATSADAAMINLRYQSNVGATGTLGGTAFDTSIFYIDLVVDNSSWLTGGSLATASTATVTIGSSTYDFVTPLRAYINPNGGTGVTKQGGGDLFGFSPNATVAAWDR